MWSAHASHAAHSHSRPPNLLRLQPLHLDFAALRLSLSNLTTYTKPALNHPIPQDAMGGKSASKSQYFDKLKSLLEEYHSIFIVGVDNVSSQQMHEIRHAMRNKGVILMGNNTMVR